jgi:hypothetical protein
MWRPLFHRQPSLGRYLWVECECHRDGLILTIFVQVEGKYSNIAAKGCKPGTKYIPRSLLSPSYSWNETCTKAVDWIPVQKSQENISWW